MSCVQFELRVECCSIVKTEEGITADKVHRLYMQRCSYVGEVPSAKKAWQLTT